MVDPDAPQPVGPQPVGPAPAVRGVRSPSRGALWVGLDGGATKLALCTVEEDAEGRLVPGGRRGHQDWPDVAGFEPLPLARQREQLAELAAGGDPRGPRERDQAETWLHTVANAVTELLQGLPARPVVLGLCLPGLKDAAEREVLAMANGPRLPRFLDRLEEQLRARNVPLAQPLTRLASDACAAAWGEALARDGRLHGVPDGLVLGVGTGLAEALVRDGRHHAPEGLARTGPAAHATALRDLAPDLVRDADPGDLTVEQAVGLAGVQRALAREGADVAGLRAVDAARRGDPLAAALLTRAARALGRWVGDRARRLDVGGAGPERLVVVLGQRGAWLLEDPAAEAWWGAPLRAELALGPLGARLALVASRLRDAPALGALGEALGRVRLAGAD